MTNDQLIAILKRAHHQLHQVLIHVTENRPWVGDSYFNEVVLECADAIDKAEVDRIRSKQ